MTSLDADSRGAFPESPAVHLADALRKQLEAKVAELATEKAERLRLQAVCDEMRERYDAMKIERDVAVSMRVGLEEAAAYWKGKAEIKVCRIERPPLTFDDE